MEEPGQRVFWEKKKRNGKEPKEVGAGGERGSEGGCIIVLTKLGGDRSSKVGKHKSGGFGWGTVCGGEGK